MLWRGIAFGWGLLLFYPSSKYPSLLIANGLIANLLYPSWNDYCSQRLFHSGFLDWFKVTSDTHMSDFILR